ncbi:MAG: molybdopterin oxidoreductase family protein [Acidimicrobiia bacterium]
MEDRVGVDLLRRLGLSSPSAGQSYSVDEQFGVLHDTHRPDRWVRTTCGYCSVGCGMYVGVRQGRAVAVAGDPDHPVNRGRLCPKGLSEHQTIAAPGRLVSPLRRRSRGGAQERVGWEEAIGAVVSGFERAVDEYGPDAVAVLSTGQLVTEEFYALGKLARLGLGVRHYDGNTTLCMSSAVAGYKRSFGSDGPPGAYEDLDLADCTLLVGSNLADNHPLLAPRVMGNRRGTLIVVDPRVTKTAAIADLHLAIRPRTDIVLLNGMLKVIIDEGLVDEEYVAASTEGFAALAAHVADYPISRVEEVCGIPGELVRQAALAFGRAQRAFAGWTMGVNHSVQGTETVTLLNSLCLVTGNIGRPGAAPFSITGQCNAMGTREAGGTASLPGYRAWESDDDRAELAGLWGVPVERIPSQRGGAYPDIIDGVLDGTIRALWVIGTNPPVSFPHRGRLERAFRRLDLLVVQDGFETPTTRLADVVLPGAIWGEKDGTYTNSERRVSRVRKAVEPPGLARSDFEIFLAVADFLGCRDELYPGWSRPEDAFVEWARVSQGRLCDYSGMTWDRLEESGGIQWPCPADSDRQGTPRLYGEGRFPTASGRAKLWCVEALPISDAVDQYYPFVLNTGRTVEHWHTRTKTGRVGILEALAPEAWLEIHPDDAAGLGLVAGESVRLVSRRGELEGVTARVTATVRPGEVFMPFHYDEACVNHLTVDEFDPISREPNYKQSAVRIERIA